MFFFGSTKPPSCGHGRRNARHRRHRCCAVGVRCIVLRRDDGDDDDECRRRLAGGDVAARSVTVGDRLAQKSDRHRPLSLRPVSSLRRRIYMQFLLIVLLCVVMASSVVSAAIAALVVAGRRPRCCRHLCNSAYRNNRTCAGVTKILENVTETCRRRFLFIFHDRVIAFWRARLCYSRPVQ